MKDSTEGISIPPPPLSYLAPPLAFIGDTFHHVGTNVEPLLGFQPNKAMVQVSFQTRYWHADSPCVQVYAGVFPFDSSEFPRLEESIKRVCSPFQKPLWILITTKNCQLTLTGETHSFPLVLANECPKTVVSPSSGSLRLHSVKAADWDFWVLSTWMYFDNAWRTNTMRA